MDVSKLMGEAQKMQKLIKEKNDKFYSRIFEFEYQGVYLKFSGKKELTKISIEESLLKEHEMLQDYLQVAINRALQEIDKEYKEIMGALSEIPTSLF